MFFKPSSQRSKLERQKGLSMVMVLTFMILAGITALGVWTASKRSFERGTMQAHWQTSEEAIRAGLAASESWITNEGLDAVGIFQAFYDKYNADGVFVPIKLPLDSFKVDKGNKDQDFEVYLTSFNPNSKPMEFTLEIVGKGQSGATGSMSYAFTVEGMYLEVTNVSTYTTAPVFESEYGLFNGGGFNAFNTGFTVDGNMYGGENVQTNAGASIVVNGDLTLGNGHEDSYYNSSLTVNGRYYSWVPFYTNGGNYTINGPAWFRGGIKYIQGPLYVDGDMIIDKKAFYAGNQQGALVTVTGNAWFRDETSLKGTSHFKRDVIFSGDLKFQNSNDVNTYGTSVYMGKVYTDGNPGTDINNYGDAWFNNSFDGVGRYDRVADQGTGTKYNNWWSLWAANGYTGVSYPDTTQFDDLKNKLNTSGSHDDPFTVDSSVANTVRKTWSWFQTNACGSDCKNSNNFDATNLNAFYKNAPDSARLKTKDVNGNDMEWIVVDMNGAQYNTPYDENERLDGKFILVWDGVSPTFNNRLPRMLSTSRVMYWFKNGSSPTGTGMLGTDETCYCLIIAEGGGSTVQISGNQTWKGGFFVMNGGEMSSNSGYSNFVKDGDIFKDFVVTGLLTQKGSSNTYASSRNIDKSLRVNAPTLSVNMMGAFKQVKTVEELEADGSKTIDAEKKVFLAIYPNVVKVSKGAYSTWDSLKAAMNIRALYSYDRERGDDSTIASSAKHCSGNWEGTTTYENIFDKDSTVDFTYTVTCAGGGSTVSVTRTGAIVVGTGASGASSSSGNISSSSDSLSSSVAISSTTISSSVASSSSDAGFCYDLSPQVIKYYSGEDRNSGYLENTNDIKGVARQWPNNQHEFTYLNFDLRSFTTGDLTKATLTMDVNSFSVYGYVDMYLVPAKAASHGTLGSYGAYGFYDTSVKFGKTRITTEPSTITFTPDSLLLWANNGITGFERSNGLLIVGAGQYGNPGQADIGLTNFNLQLCRSKELSSSVATSSADVSSSSTATSTPAEIQHTLTFVANPAAGAVIKCTINGTTYTDKCSGAEGSSVVVNVIETSGYGIKYWSDNHSITTLTRTLTMPAYDSTFTITLAESSVSNCINATKASDYVGSTGSCYNYVKVSGLLRIGNWTGQTINFKVVDSNGVDYYITSGSGDFTATDIPNGTLTIYQLTGDNLKYQLNEW